MHQSPVATTCGDAAAPAGVGGPGCGSTTSPTMQSSMAPSQVVLGGRKVAIRRPRVRRDGAGAADPAWRVALDDEAFVVNARGRCTVGRAARRGSRAPACGRWQGSIPVSDALWAQRLTPSPAPGRHVAFAGAGPRAPRVMVSFCDVGSAAAPREVLEAHIPGLAGLHPGIRRSADPTTDRGQSYMALSKPRTTEPGSRDDHADTGHHLAPGATHLPGAAPVTAEIA